jgi:hypothetical protein
LKLNLIAAPQSKTPLLRQFSEQFGKLSEITKLGAASACILRACRRKDKHLRAVNAPLLKPQFARPLREILIRTLAIEGDYLWRELLELLGQHDAPFGVFFAP